MYYTVSKLNEETGEVIETKRCKNMTEVAEAINLDYFSCCRVFRMMNKTLQLKRCSTKYARLMKMFKIEQELGFLNNCEN